MNRIVIIQIIESIRFSFKSLRVNILRTILSLSGITVGIFCIIAVLSLVASLELGMKKSFDMIGDDLIFIQKWPMSPEEGDEEYAWWKYMSRRQPQIKDCEELQKRLTSADAVAFQTATGVVAEFRNNSLQGMHLIGSTFDYQDVVKLDIEEGRYFTNMEAEGGRNVCLIGHQVKMGLFGEGPCLGKTIKVGGLELDIIGLYEKEGASLLQNGFDFAIHVPAKFATRLIDMKRVDNSILVKAKEGVSNEELKDEVMSTFRDIRRLKPTQDNDFSIIEATMITAILDAIFGTMDIAGYFIGIFALLVGAFGILNIMFVTIRERTNIIGIQKALGARNYFIMASVLFESVFLCCIGGILGLLLIGVGVILLNVQDLGFEFVLTMSNIIIGLSISVVLGIVAGIVPAYLASRMDPVVAMRS
jgi:putative ABC transport system permease protein